MAEFRVAHANWNEQHERLMQVREQVFVVEQGVPRELERDEFDFAAFHVVADSLDGRPIGTGRLLADGRIGRMCVLLEYRGQGVGASLLAALLEEARRRGHREVTLHAQIHAQKFYEKFGFQSVGEPYEEAGITHLSMTLPLSR
jgi:predicted GNAT family N-acyltransferase